MTQITLPADFTQRCLEEIHVEVCALLEANPTISVDGSAVEKVDGAGVQYMAMLLKLPLDEPALVNPSPALDEAMRFLLTSDENISAETGRS